MADENISNELYDDLRKVVAGFGSNTRFLTDNMKQVIDRVNKGLSITSGQLDQFQKELREATYSAGKFGNDLLNVSGAAGSLAATMGRGDDTFRILKDTVDIAVGAIGAMSKGIGAAIGAGFGPIGKAIGSKIGAVGDDVAKIGGKVVNFFIDMYDSAQKSFHTLAQIGSIDASGVDGMVRRFGDLGVPMETFGRMVSQNSSTLAMLNGSVTQGIDGMIKGFQQLEKNDLDQQLRNLGMQTEEIGDTMIAYADLQRRLGNQRYMDEEQLRRGTLAYGKELDVLSKLTGKSREQAQQAMNQAMLNERFQAKLRQMQANGQTAAADELRKAVQLQTLAGNKDYAEAIMSASTGFFTTPQAQAAAAAMPGFMDNVNGLVSGTENFASFTQNLQDSAKIYEQNFRGLAMAVGPDSKVTKMYLDSVNLTTMNGGELAKAIKDVQNNVTQASEVPTENTKNLTNTVESLQKATANLQQTLLTGEAFPKLMNAASEGLLKFTEVVKDAILNWNSIDKDARQEGSTTAKTQAREAAIQADKDVINAAEKLAEVRGNEKATIAELEKAEREFLESRIRAKDKYEQKKISAGVASANPDRAIGKFSKQEQKIAEKYDVKLPTTLGELTTAVNNLNTTMSNFSNQVATPVPETPLQQVLDPKFEEKYDEANPKLTPAQREATIPPGANEFPEVKPIQPEVEVKEPKIEPIQPEVEVKQPKIEIPKQPEVSQVKAGPSYAEAMKQLQKTGIDMQTQAAEIANAVKPDNSQLIDAYKKAIEQANQGKPQPMTEETGKELVASMNTLPEYIQTLIGETKKNGMYTRNA